MGSTAKGEISKYKVFRCRLAAVCCQAVVIYGCLRGCREASARVQIGWSR